MSRRHAARALALAGLALRAAAGWFRRVASLALLWIRRTPRPPRLAAIGFAVALTALGAGGLAFQLVLPALLPSPLDWRAAAALLERDGRPGDAVLASPGWAERIRMLTPRVLPVLAQSRFARAETEGVRRIWLVSLTGAPGFSFKPEVDLLARSAAPDPPLAVGRLQIGRFEITHPDLPLATLAERLAAAAVEMGGQPCTESGGIFQCDAERAQVTLENGLVEVNGLPRPCLVARATGSAGPVSVTFPSVPLGREIRGNAGVPTASGAGSIPLTVAIRVDGEEVAAVQLEGAGWPSFRIDTTRWAGQKHALALRLVVPEGPALCLQAVTLP